MTTIDLLRRYPHKENETKGLDSSTPNHTMPDLDPSQHFDPKTRLLHDMLDRVVKDLASSQSESASEWDGTLWRSPLRPRSRSPAYSEISDSFESPGRIEHCTNDLLLSPISPTSTQFKGPDGWPLGIEVAMNDFQRGRLSTPTLQETELPNRLILRKQQQQTPRLGGGDSREGPETGSCTSVPLKPQCDSERQQENVRLRPLAFHKHQSSVLSQQYDERQAHLESANLKPLPCQQQSFTCPQQHSDCQYQQKNEDVQLTELQSDEETHLDVLHIPTLSALKYGGKDRNTLRNASTDLDPALKNGNVPIGLAFENAGLERSIFQIHGEEHDGSHTRTDFTCLIHKDIRQTVLSGALPRNKEINGSAHRAELPISALADTCSEKTGYSKALGVVDSTNVESTDCETGCHNTLKDSWNDNPQSIEPPKSEDSNAIPDKDAVPCRLSGLLQDILEQTEDLLTNISTLNQGQPQHSTSGSAQPPNLHKSGGADERRDSMLALQGPKTRPSTPSSSSQCVPHTLELTINPSTKMQFESTKFSVHDLSDAKSPQPTLSAATMAELKDTTRKEGHLSPAALAELRKTAESQPHFHTEPDSPADHSQAQIHPLLRSKSFSRPSSQPSRTANDSALKYVFEEDDNDGNEIEKKDSVSHQITTRAIPCLEVEAQGTKSSDTLIPVKEHTTLLFGKMRQGALPGSPCKEHDTNGQKSEYTRTFTPQTYNLGSSNDSTLVPSFQNVRPFLPTTSLSTMNGLCSLEVESPDAMPSSISQPLILPASTGHCLTPAVGSPAPYNSWASTPHHHELGTSCSTPSSAATLPTSTVPTPNTASWTNSPTSCGMTMTPASSLGQISGSLAPSRETKMTPSASFGQFVENEPNHRGMPMTPSSSLGDLTDNKVYRRSLSLSSVFARYHKTRYADLPTPATTDSMVSSKESAEWDQSGEATNDPFTSTHDSSTPFSLIVKAPSKENLANFPIRAVDRFNTPTKRNSGRFSLPRRSLSTCERPNTNEGLERALSSLIFNPHRSRHQERSDSASYPIDSARKPGGSGFGRRRSLNIATNNANQKWETAPPPTTLCLRDEFSMRYRPETVEAHDHYATRKDALQGMKRGLRKVFSRQ